MVPRDPKWDTLKEALGNKGYSHYAKPKNCITAV